MPVALYHSLSPKAQEDLCLNDPQFEWPDKEVSTSTCGVVRYGLKKYFFSSHFRG